MGARGPKPQPKEITGEHVQILVKIANGWTNPQIAAQMNRSEHWVNDQLKIIFAVLGVRTRAQAVAVAVQKRILSHRLMR
jgi:two-component system, NarL family, response regulator YdfI